MMHTISWPSVSVVVPVYNGAALLGTLLASLERLDYPRDRLEVLLVDNNSTDATAALIAESPFTGLFEERPGCGTARNAGIRQARGAFIACTDADCVVDPHWLKDLVAGFDGPAIGAVAGTIAPYELNNPVERYEALRLRSPGHRPTHPFLPTACTANVMYRSAIFQEVGLLLDRSGGEETDFNWRMQKAGYQIHFLEQGGLVHHRYRTDLQAFCRSQHYKARTLVDLHRRWNLRVPTGRKELARAAAAGLGLLPKVAVHTLVRGRDLHDSAWEAWLDVVVPWTRFRGIRGADRSA